ncbi:MAG TPA: glycosyltransferase [Coleofasciculaceae cyanobacterium]
MSAGLPTPLATNAGKARVLIIPHQPNRNIKVRAIEIGRYLAGPGGYEVFMLTWQPTTASSGGLPVKVLQKSMEALATTCLSTRIDREDGLNWVTLPHLLAPYPWCQHFNRQQVSRFARAQNIQIILSGNAYHFPMPDAPDILRIYDVVDDHISPESGPHWRRTRQFTLAELAKSDRILTISHALQEALAQEGFSDTLRVPNGVDLAAFRQTPSEEVRAFREQYHLEGRFTLGYIGNHGWWSGMDLLLAAFERLKARVPESRLLIIGPGEDLPRYQEQMAGNPDIIFTGPIPPERIAACFQAVDIGVLPFQICPFTDNALPLKILEYGAARKRVLATPLKELKTLAFPHVSLLEPDPELWVAALEQEANAPLPWDPRWDSVIAGYDWPVVLAELPRLLEVPHAAAV